MRFLLLILLYIAAAMPLCAQEEGDPEAAEAAELRGRLPEGERADLPAGGKVLINRAGWEELLLLGVLTHTQVAAVLRYRQEMGPFGSIWELQAVPGLDESLLRRLLPLVRVEGEGGLLGNGVREGAHLLLGRVTVTPDYTTPLLQYRFGGTGGLSWGGAVRGWGNERQYHLHAVARLPGPLRTLVLGDYRLRLGQGLIHGQGLMLGQASGVAGMLAGGPRLQPQRSAAATGFNRGAAVEGGGKNWSALLFGSFLRSADEGTQKGGASFHYIRKRLSAGAQGLYWRRDPPARRARGYGALLPDGREGWKGSVDWRYVGSRALIFGEGAVDDRGATAWLAGWMATPHPAVDLGLLYRRLAPGFEGGSAFTQASVPGNERGLYAGWTLRPAAGWTVNGAADIFLFPFHRYRVAGTSRGREGAIGLMFKPARGTELHLRYRGNSDGRRSVRIHAGGEDLLSTWEGRAEAVWTGRGAEKETGWVVFAGWGTKLGSGFSLRSRLMWGATEGWESRIYAFEPDVRYGFSLPPFAGSGGRCLLLAGWNRGRHWRLGARWSQPIGYQSYKVSGEEEAEPSAGNASFKLQAEYRW